MKRLAMMLTCAALAAIPLVVGAEDEQAQKPALPEEVACAVQTGNKVNVQDALKSGKYADYEYTRYFFCCDGCPQAFKKDPEKFAQNAGVSLSHFTLPKEVPCAVMTDHKVNVKEATEAKHFADYNGRRYFFCCNGCPQAFQKDPEKFASHTSVPIGQLPLPKEVHCAVQTGKQVDVQKAIANKQYADFKGRRYFFCCNGCPAAFKSDPEKFASNDSLPSPKVEKKAEKAE